MLGSYNGVLMMALTRVSLMLRLANGMNINTIVLATCLFLSMFFLLQFLLWYLLLVSSIVCLGCRVKIVGHHIHG